MYIVIIEILILVESENSTYFSVNVTNVCHNKELVTDRQRKIRHGFHREVLISNLQCQMQCSIHCMIVPLHLTYDTNPSLPESTIIF